MPNDQCDERNSKDVCVKQRMDATAKVYNDCAGALYGSDTIAALKMCLPLAIREHHKTWEVNNQTNECEVKDTKGEEGGDKADEQFIRMKFGSNKMNTMMAGGSGYFARDKT